MENSKSSSRQKIESLMGNGKVISKVLDQIEKYANIDKPILIEGETGTGKELIAGYLRDLSSRKEMVTVNCGSLSKELADSELFGSVKGAYTDAQNRTGKVEAAKDGILFLDEINSLPFSVQVNLLKFIECGTFTKVGDNVEHKANVRIIAAGNESFEKLVAKGEFRQDLYERFVQIIYVPSLKERIEDIDFFIDRFLSEYNEESGKNVCITDEARKLLVCHNWSGNIRQLKNFIETLVIEAEPDELSGNYIIEPRFVWSSLNKRRHKKTDNIPEGDIPEDDDYTLQSACKTAHDNAAKAAISRALEKANGNNEDAMKLLGVSRGTYYKLKKEHGIK
ncbi:MAG: sigma 54-interacting transcriptional regulator [Bacteroidales bacterium]|nr:sigma 54-interacting transcriptional regulator [Bacteroidales bacterium]